MSEIHVNKDQVRRLVVAMVHTAADTRAHPVEVCLAFAEAVGRTIAAQDGAYDLHNELLRVTHEHMVTTVKAAYSSAGKNAGGIK